eukprot:TRINITY_DN1905_c0_g1_i1.p1 TRINITY_DN1905_c0_g1~~TRINITY_DN1905_c0_g1_i1.p1  ORF type:complete len:428 (+),score=87.60 TRINITY_DN1905_c0_g1_i1:446-1729(+)
MEAVSKRDLFGLADPPAVFLNHGSYGTVPKLITERRAELLRELEQHPDVWFRSKSKRMWADAVQCLEELLNPPTSQSVVFVENATAGINCVVQSTAWKTIVHFDTTYGAVKQAISFHNHKHSSVPWSVSVAPDKLGVSDLCDRLRNAFTELGPDAMPGLLIVDHISSCPALVFPIKKIISVAREYGFLVLVDGAHAIGQMHIDLSDIQPDFYVSNLHKWLYAPKSSAFLYVSQKLQEDVHPLFISHEYRSSFQREFYMVGTRDFTSYFCSQACLNFIESLLGGLDQMRSHINSLLIQGVDILMSKWNTPLMTNIMTHGSSNPETCEVLLGAPFLANVQLPFTYEEFVLSYSEEQDHKEVDVKNEVLRLSHHKGGLVMTKLLEEYHIQTVAYEWHGKLWARVSSQVYNSLSDYHELAEAVWSIKLGMK